MRLFFGKALRRPICQAFSALCGYLNDIVDVHEMTWGTYMTLVGTNIYREHTVYSITDEQPPQDWTGYHVLCDGLEGGYLGETELQCGVYGHDVMFIKRGA